MKTLQFSRRLLIQRALLCLLCVGARLCAATPIQHESSLVDDEDAYNALEGAYGEVVTDEWLLSLKDDDADFLEEDDLAWIDFDDDALFDDEIIAEEKTPIPQKPIPIEEAPSAPGPIAEAEPIALPVVPTLPAQVANATSSTTPAWHVDPSSLVLAQHPTKLTVLHPSKRQVVASLDGAETHFDSFVAAKWHSLAASSAQKQDQVSTASKETPTSAPHLISTHHRVQRPSTAKMLTAAEETHTSVENGSTVSQRHPLAERPRYIEPNVIGKASVIAALDTEEIPQTITTPTESTTPSAAAEPSPEVVATPTSLDREPEIQAPEIEQPPALEPTLVPEETPVPVEAPIPVTPTPEPEATPTPPIEQVPAPIPAAVPTTPVEQIPVPTPTPASIESLSASTAQQEGYLIKFNDVSIIEYIRFISKITGRNFVFNDADLAFNVTIVSEELASIQDIVAALLQELRIHDMSLLEQGNNIIIHRNPAVKSPAAIVGDTETTPSLQPHDLVTRVFRLNTLSADQASSLATPLLSTQAIIEPVPGTSNIVITDLKTNVDKLAQLFQNIDSPVGGLEIGQYVVRNTYGDALITIAEKILAPIAQNKTLTLTPHSSSNSIFIVSTPFLVKYALSVLSHLDSNKGATGVLSMDIVNVENAAGPGQETTTPLEQGIPPSGIPGLTGVEGVTNKWSPDLPSGHLENTLFYIHKLQYRHGDQIQVALRRVADSMQQMGGSNEDLVAAIYTVQWLEAPNSLVFSGTPAAIERVKALIDEIDVPLRQVFIDMLILDTSLNDALSFSVDAGTRFGGPSSAGSQAFLSPGSALPFNLDQAGLPPPITLNPAPLVRSDGFGIGVIGRNITRFGTAFSSMGAIVHALHADTDIKIVHNPKILAEDNVPAEIFVGINTIFKTQSVANNLGTILTNNFEFRDVGTRIRIIPLLGNSDIVTLDILQETTSIDTGSPLNEQAAPTTRKSKTTTRVHLPNNYFLIISGIIQDEDTQTRSQMPCLGGIPILGAAVSNTNHIDTKRNLLLFIRPTIIDTAAEMDEITKRQQDIYHEKSRVKDRWMYEVDEALDFFNLTSGAEGPCD